MCTHLLNTYSSKHLDKVFKLWIRNDYYKGIDPAALKKHLSWKYDKKYTQLWVVEDHDRIIASNGRINTSLLSKGQVIGGGPWGIDLLVDKSLGLEERTCIFLKVFRKMMLEGFWNNKPEMVLLNPGEIIRDSCLRMGWLDVPIFFKYSKLISADHLKSNNEASGDLEISLIKSFDHRWDSLWFKFSRSFSLIVLREHAYLNWRYFKNLDKKYLVFLVKLRNEIKGYLVVREGVSKGKKVGHIVDFLVEDQGKKSDMTLHQ